jgi:hypothetical protein
LPTHRLHGERLIAGGRMLKTRAFVTAGFREPLLVGSLAIQRASRQDFALFNRIVVAIIALSDGT